MVEQPPLTVGQPGEGVGSHESLLDAGVLDAASERLESVYGHRLREDWTVVQLHRRRKSTVFELASTDTFGNRLVVFYKIPGDTYSDRAIPVSELNRLAAVERLLPFTDLFNELADGTNLRAAPVLAIDPPTMATVTLGIPGRNLTSYLSGLRPGRLGYLNNAMFQLGRACRHLEKVNRQWPESAEPAVMTATDFTIRRFGEHLDQNGHDQLWALAREVEAIPRSSTFGHGDMFGSNVLVDSPRVGLIDFSAAPQLRMLDLAYVAFRAAGHTRLTVSARRKMIRQLLDGYGGGELATNPEWRLARALMALRHMGRSRYRARAALAGNEADLSTLLEDRDPWLSTIRRHRPRNRD